MIAFYYTLNWHLRPPLLLLVFAGGLALAEPEQPAAVCDSSGHTATSGAMRSVGAGGQFMDRQTNNDNPFSPAKVGSNRLLYLSNGTPLWGRSVPTIQAS